MSEEEQNNLNNEEEEQNPVAGGSSSEAPVGNQETEGSSSEEPTEAQQEEEASSSESESDALPHYHQSPNMICAKLRMNGIDADTVEKLKAMNIDRRWERDNRIPTWAHGLVNMGHDFHFVHQGGIVCDTDNRLMKIEKDVETEDGTARKIVATRNIRYNGQGLQIDTSRDTDGEEGESSSSN